MMLDKLTIMSDILLVLLVAGVSILLYGSIMADTTVASCGGGILGLFLILLVAVRKSNKT